MRSEQFQTHSPRGNESFIGNPSDLCVPNSLLQVLGFQAALGQAPRKNAEGCAQRAPKRLLLFIKGPVVKSHYIREPICYKFGLILEVGLRSCVAVILGRVRGNGAPWGDSLGFFSQVSPHKAERKSRSMFC